MSWKYEGPLDHWQQSKEKSTDLTPGERSAKMEALLGMIMTSGTKDTRWHSIDSPRFPHLQREP